MKRTPLSPSDLVLLVAGVTRGVQLVLHDDILRRPRRAVRKASRARAEARRSAGDPEAFAYADKLLTCPWCMSVWLSAAALVGLRLFPRLTRGALRVASLSLAAVATDLLVDRLEGAPGALLDVSQLPTAVPPPEVAAVLAAQE